MAGIPSLPRPGGRNQALGTPALRRAKLANAGGTPACPGKNVAADASLAEQNPNDSITPELRHSAP